MTPWKRWKLTRAAEKLRESRTLDAAEVARFQDVLRAVGDEAISVLLECLADGGAREPALAVLAERLNESRTDEFLEHLASRNPGVVSGVTRILSEGRPDVRCVLAALDDARYSRPALETVLAAQGHRLSPQELIAGFGAATKDSRVVRLRLLEKCADARILEPVGELLTHESWWVRLYMTRLLARIGTGKGIQLLVSVLHDEHKSVRLEAVQSLSHLEAAEAVPAMVPLLRDPDLKVQSAVIDAVSALGSAATVPLLLEVLKDESEHARRGAVEVLNRVATPDAIQDLVRALHDADWWVRVRAADALGTLGGERVVEAVIGLLRDPDEFLRRYGVEILNSVPSARAVEPLIAVLDDPDWWVRERAIDALAEAGDVRAVTPILELMERHPDTTPLVARALGAFPDPRAVDALVALATNAATEVRREARSSLERLATLELPEAETARVRAALAGTAVPLSAARSEAAPRAYGPESGRSEPEPKLPPRAVSPPRTEPAAVVSRNLHRLAPGTVLRERFEIKDRVGQGGFGVVYLAQDRVVGEEIILKVLNPQLAVDDEALARFVQELKLTRRVSHENVIRIHDFLDLDGGYAVSMEYFESRDLGRILAEGGRQEPGWVMRLAEQVCHGLDAAHAAGVIHRDIKPGNILVNDSGQVKIVDFGLAASRQRVGSRLTKSGILLGTPDYMAPEQITGAPVGGRADLYSLGVVMFEALTGSKPFPGETAVQILFQHLEAVCPRVSALLPVDPDLDDLVASLMAREPEDRPDSPAALAGRLAALRQHVEAGN